MAIPRDFKVRLVPREGATGGGIEGWLREAEERTRDAYSAKKAETV